MKRYIFALLCALFSIAGIAQQTAILELDSLAQPFLPLCDELLDWENQDNGGYDCILSATFYVKEFTVPVGMVLNQLVFEPDSFFVFDDNMSEFIGSYHGFEEINEPYNSFGLMEGFYLLNEESEIILSHTRNEIASQLNSPGNNSFAVDNLNLQAGNYELRFIHNEGDFLGFESPMITISTGKGNFQFPNIATSPLNAPSIEGPEIFVSSVVLNFELTVPEMNIQPIYNACDGEVIEIYASCVSQDIQSEYSYQWERYIPELSVWFTLPNEDSCVFSRTFVFDPSGDEENNLRKFRLVRNFTFSEPDSVDFDVIINPTPAWGYEDSIYSFEEDDNLFIFDLKIPSETMNFLYSDINGNFVWNVNQEFTSGTNLLIDTVYAGGFGCGFLCSPFENESDSIASYVVDVELMNGCAASDTTYIVFIDVDGSGGWSPGDSIDFRNFLILPGDTTGTDSTVFIKEVRKPEIKLYPNPASEVFTIQHNLLGIVQLNISNMTGQLIRQERLFSPTTQIDVFDLPKGIYLVTISNQDGRQITTTRLVKL